MTSRRQFLQTTSCGFGGLALSALANGSVDNPLQPRLPPMPARAKRVIFVFMQGGPSHVDTFDYKPLLFDRDGQMVDFFDARKIANSGDKAATAQRVMKPMWDFSQHGQSGRYVSSLFPEIARHVDDLCFIHSMHTEGIAHGPATLFLHCGATNFIRPSMGSWITYGLGSESENLPGFVTIGPSTGNGGARNYGSAFLPPVYQGTPLGRADASASAAGFRNIGNSALPVDQQRERFDFLQALNAAQLARRPGDLELEAAINSFELAWRLQSHAPEVTDLSGESAATLELYGIHDGTPTADFGRKCLLARRLCESGVRFVQVTYGDNTANPAWDQHSNLPKHADHALAVDKPVAGLLEDLKQRGLLEDTIVWFGGEFGRTPYAQGNGTGRDHNPKGFTTWLAGGGFKPGYAHGATDEFGHMAVQDKVHMHDLHATILHQLGLDHKKLTYRFDGRNFRLTDVHGHVVRAVLA
ncbi:MAG TPA: DUF1501 domain-containing protein [Verrucomicrobiales bacterium]|nr:DUF1501 domain-containing protein [Verrucomicrobiales bacterium]